MPLDWLRKSLSGASATPGNSSGGGARQKSGRVEGARDGDPDWQEVVRRVHGYWRENDLRWRFLMDSLAAGIRYSNAIYGVDRQGLPVRNLIRHRNEVPDPQTYQDQYYGFPGNYASMALGGADLALGIQGFDSPFGPLPGLYGSDPHSTAHDDPYEYRRARAVCPPFVKEAVAIHLSKVYDQEVRREGPDDLAAWWDDVDGRGTPMDDWMRQAVAPLFLSLGCLDVCLDHPKAPPGESIETRADEDRLGLDRCVASYILPQNVVWWKLDAAGRYEQVLIREFVDPSERRDFDKKGNAIDPGYQGPDRGKSKAADTWRRSYVRYRFWTAAESVLLSYAGDQVLERVPHRFGVVPIVRLIDQPDFHAPHVGLSRYEVIARYQREFYNTSSELVFSNSLQAHPVLSGPEDFCKSDSKVPMGPGNILPMKKNPEGNSYQGWAFVSPPKDPAASLRQDLQDIVDRVDRIACLAKPAGAVSGSTTAQSGISKQMDHSTGHKLLHDVAKSLAKAERTLSEYALVVIRNGPLAPDDPARKQIAVAYPARFELRDAETMAPTILQFQAALSQAGDAPEAEGEMLLALELKLLQDLDDATIQALRDEMQAVMESKARIREQLREALPGIADRSEAMEGDGSAEQGAGADRLGQSSGTSITGFIPQSV